jgi:tetratricopeptide (TPR) repeat protein
MTPVPEPLDAAAVLNAGHDSYHKPYRIAWAWNRSKVPDDLKRAEQLLTRLTDPDQFAFAVPIWYERAFNLVRQGRPDEAVAVLKDVVARFPGLADEDILCLWGRIHKDRGSAALAADDLAAAEREFTRAEERYEKAYGLRGHRFPGINIATLRFVRAGLIKTLASRPFGPGAETAGLDRETAGRDAAATLQESAREMAAVLVAARATWRDELADDAIWRLATLAEAYVLLGEWDTAKRAYADALAPGHNPQPFHAETMRDQLRRLLDAYVRLGDKPREPNEFLPPPA